MSINTSTYCRYHTTTTGYRSRPNSGHFHGNYTSNVCSSNDGIQLSSRAQIQMWFKGLTSTLQDGPLGKIMSSFGIGGPNGQNRAQMHPLFLSHPGFGEPNRANNVPMHFRQTQGGPPGLDAAFRRVSGNFNPQPHRGAMDTNAPQAPRGKATEMKAGQTMKAPNGSLVTWGKDGNVGIKYKGPDGKMRTVDVKDGMLSLDGGKPTKLENVGQLLKLPNGDVVGLGNNPQGPDGKKLCRVVVADNVDQVKTEPASATNIYDLKTMQESQTSMVPTRFDFNFNSSSFDGHCGDFHSNSFRASVTTGRPIITSRTYQELSYNSVI